MERRKAKTQHSFHCDKIANLLERQRPAPVRVFFTNRRLMAKSSNGTTEFHSSVRQPWWEFGGFVTKQWNFTAEHNIGQPQIWWHLSKKKSICKKITANFKFTQQTTSPSIARKLSWAFPSGVRYLLLQLDGIGAGTPNNKQWQVSNVQYWYRNKVIYAFPRISTSLNEKHFYRRDTDTLSSKDGALANYWFPNMKGNKTNSCRVRNCKTRQRI